MKYFEDIWCPGGGEHPSLAAGIAGPYWPKPD